MNRQDHTTNHRTPAYRLVVDGRDISPTVNPRLISLTVTECRGGEADQLELTLSDHDGKLAIPPKDAEIAVHIGWRGQPLVDKGTFTVDEVEHSGAPDVITIRARSADMLKELRVRNEKSWHGQTVGAIVGAIAGRHGLTPKVGGDLAGIAVQHIDQTHESDINFVTRLARRFDAVATVKKGALLFLPIDGTRMGALTFTRMAGDSHRWHTADRNAYSGVRAFWHDPGKAQRRGVLVGQSGNAKRLKETFANEADARAEAQAEWRRVQRGAATFELTLAMGEPRLMPQATVAVTGFKPEIDSTDWLVIKATHSLGDGGLTTRVELEIGDASSSAA